MNTLYHANTVAASTTGYVADPVIQSQSVPGHPVVALFNASDDTVEMVRRMLGASDFNCVIGCHFADLRKGSIDFARYLEKQDPEVVIIDISPPYLENWNFFKTL